MKKTLLLLASAAMLLVGCAKETLSPEAGDGEMVNMTVTASVQGEELTKAAVDNDGMGVHADRCIMVLYYGDKVYGRYQATVSGYHATFDVKVPAKRTYKAVFWADCAAEDGGDLYYNTADLKNITLKSAYVGNNDKRDAFFKCKEYTVENKSQSFTAELTRPFSQINVISTDIQALKLAELYPQKVNLSFSAATSFNAMSGECGDAEAITYEADVYKAFDSTKEQLTLSMDYLFASTEQGAVDIEFKAPTEGELKVEYSFTNIPYQRNYRTNIVGNLLTADAHWDVTINHNWNEPDEEVKFVEAGSVAAANEAFANGATSVKITSVGEETTLYLPQTTEEVTIDFANPDKDVTVKYGSTPTKAAGDKPAAVNIATNDVTKFTVSGLNNLVWLAGNQVALANALTNATNKQVVALSNDITMSGEWTPVTTKNSGGYYIGTFDGKNHVISNLKITDYTGTYAGFFSTISGATIKNVTFKNATVTNAVSNEGARGAVIVGWSYAGVIDNCHVINSSVTGGQKVAGIVGCISVEGAASKNEVTNCSVEGLTLSSNIPNDILYQAGALVGYMQLVAANPNGILIENNTVKDITINDAFNGPDNKAWYCGTFIGSIIRKQQVDGQKIVLNNNTISGTNTELYKSMYSSEYFGWTSNAEEYSGAIAPILIDGVEWNPAFYMDAEGKYHVTNLEALKYFRDHVNGGNTYNGKTILLDADIDMAGEAWTPIGDLNGYPSTTLKGIFDGQNHTISNLTCTDDTQNNACAGLFGSLEAGTIKNVILKDVNINSTHYAGGIVAYSSSFASKVENCKVIGGTITSTPELLGAEYDNGDKVGGIFGYNGQGGTITNCYVEGVTITAYRDLGAIAGASVVENITNNKAKDCVLSIDRTNFYGDKDVNAAPIVGRNLGGTLNANNTAENVTVALSANTVDAIRAAVKAVNDATSAGAYTITIADGTYEVSDLLIRKNVSGKSLLMKAANPKGATLKVKAGGENPYIFIFDGCSSYDETRTTSFKGINFDLSAISSTTAVAQSMSGNENRYGAGIIFDGCDLTGGNSMNLNAMYFSSPNHSSPNVVIKNCSIANVGYLASCYAGEFVAENVTTTTNVKHFINNQTSGITTVKDCVVNCNTDYAIRSNGGSISITGSTFNMTYEGSEIGGIFVNRRPNAQLTMTGNTYPASYAGTNMHDIYNDPDDGKGGDCILNGSITINVGESYDFPRD